MLKFSLIILFSPYLIFLTILIFFLKLIKKKIIVLDLYEFQFKYFYLPIINKMKENGKYSNIIIFGSVQLEDIFKISKYKELDVKILLPYFFVRFMKRIDIFLSSHLYVEAHKKVDRILISHGQTGKWMRAPEIIFSNFNIHFLCGYLNNEQVTESIEKYKIKKKPKLFKIGYPKIDELFYDKINNEKIKKKLNLEKKKNNYFFTYVG